MTKSVGIIGCPIRHSISPIFQQAALDYYGIDAIYEAWEVEPPSLPEYIRQLRSLNTWGINVTVPHKEAVIPLLDRVNDFASAAGAVNTIINEDGNLVGHNTDGVGFLKALEDNGHFQPQGRKVLVLGAGGSAKAVALALSSREVTEVAIANRTLERATRLAEIISTHGTDVDAMSLTDSTGTLVRKAAESDLIVNCTTLGMKYGLDEHSSPMRSEQIPATALVFDLVYNPIETPLLREAKRAGAATLGGLAMLVYQGAASFEMWTGKKAPVEIMLKVAKEALGS